MSVSASKSAPRDHVTVASFRSYAEAARAVERLSNEEFPIERVAIVAHGVRWVENVTGRRTVLSATSSGAGTGALVGALFGFFLGLVSIDEPFQVGIALALYGLVLGAVIGALLGLLLHAPFSGARDFTSTGALDAERFAVVADGPVAERARELLERSRDGSG